MLIEDKSVIHQPRDVVYALVRDDLAKLVPFLPDVERIECVKQERDGQKLKVENHWFAKVDIPKVAQKFVKPEALSWRDDAVWDDDQFLVNYELTSFIANDLFDAKGTNTFTDLGDGKTELLVSCKVEIYPERMPGVPKILARKVRPMIESLVERALGPNLAALGKGLTAYFEQQG